MQNASAVQSLRSTLSAQTAYGLTGNEDFSVKRQWVDSVGKFHTHFEQSINGIKIYVTCMIMHSNVTHSSLSANATQGNIYAVSGALTIDSTPTMSLVSRSSNDNGRQAVAMANAFGQATSDAELAYVYLPESGETKLAWKVDVKYRSKNGFEHDRVFFDAATSEKIARHSQVYRAKVQSTYTINK